MEKIQRLLLLKQTQKTSLLISWQTGTLVRYLFHVKKKHFQSILFRPCFYFSCYFQLEMKEKSLLLTYFNKIISNVKEHFSKACFKSTFLLLHNNTICKECFSRDLTCRSSRPQVFLKVSQNSQVLSCQFCETFKNFKPAFLLKKILQQRHDFLRILRSF